jgi:hypothetical protein
MASIGGGASLALAAGAERFAVENLSADDIWNRHLSASMAG